MWHTIDFAFEGGVGFGGVQHGSDELPCFNLGQIHRLINAMLSLRTRHTVLAWLGQIEASTACCAQLGNHLFVVGLGYLDINACLILEHFDDFIRSVTTPGQQTQFFSLRRRGSKGQASQNGNAHHFGFHRISQFHDYSPLLVCSAVIPEGELRFSLPHIIVLLEPFAKTV